MMNTLVPPLFAATVLAFAFSAPSAFAGLLVTGTSASGTAGSAAVLHPTMQVAAGDTGLNFGAVSFWDFRLDWDETSLAFNPNAAIISFDSYSDTLSNFVVYMQGLSIGSVYMENLATTESDGYFVFGWDGSLGTTGTVDLGAAINFSSAFTILAGTPTGDYAITFDPLGAGSFLSDGLALADYSLASPPMQITVTQAVSVPEPGMLGLLLGGLSAFLAAAILHRKTTG